MVVAREMQNKNARRTAAEQAIEVGKGAIDCPIILFDDNPFVKKDDVIVQQQS